MQKIAISFIFAVGVTGILLSVMVLNREPETAIDISQLSEDLYQSQKKIEILTEKINSLEEKIMLVKNQGPVGGDPQVVTTGPGTEKSIPVKTTKDGLVLDESVPEKFPEGTDEGILPPEILRPFSNEMEDYVFSLIGKERGVRQARQQQERVERQKMIKELSKGPFEKLNLKVNSMGLALNLGDGQKDSYFELSKFYGDEFNKIRKNVKWSDKEARDKFTKDQKQLNTEFNEDVEGILTSEQLELYRELPDWSKNPMNRSYVTPPGEKNPHGSFMINSISSDIGSGVIQLKTSIGGESQE